MGFTTPGPARSAITRVSPGMILLLSSLLPTNGLLLDVLWAEKDFRRGRSERSDGWIAGACPSAQHQARKTNPQIPTLPVLLLFQLNHIMLNQQATRNPLTASGRKLT